MTLREKLQQTDRPLIFRFGNLHLTVLADTLGRDVPEAAQDGDYIFKYLYEAAQTLAPDRYLQYYQILIELFVAMGGADHDS